MTEITTATRSTQSPEDVLFSFGAIADVQCGDLEDRTVPGLTNRYYRGALSILGSAVEFWNQRTNVPSCVLQLGDVLDGANVTHGGKEQSTRVLGDVLEECSRFKGEVHHAWGNHEFYNFTRLELLNSPLFSGRKYLRRCHPVSYKQTLSKKPSLILSQHSVSPNGLTLQGQTSSDDINDLTDETIPSYYDFSPFKGFRFVLLDTFDVSTLGYSNEDDPEREAVLQILKAHNSNKNLNDSSGLEGKERRFVSFNGGISNKQLHWLEDVLKRARNHKEKVIMFGHVPICPEVTGYDGCLVWNYQDVLTILQTSQCVIATLFGHTHQYRYHADDAGIHHFVLPGVIECQPGTKGGFVTFDMCPESMVLHRAGEEVTPLKFKYRRVT